MKSNTTQLLMSLVSCLLTYPLFAETAAVPPVELLPFTFAGRIVDYEHVAYDASATVEVRVKAQDGTLLAKTTTATYGNTAFNYAVNIPLSSAAISGHVKVGDAVIFEFVDPDGQIYKGLVSSGEATIGRPGEYRTVGVILATDANGDGVPDQYLEDIEWEMLENGYAEYDPNADWDGDGASNKAEYIAGTNPFDATDKFSVREMAQKDGIDGYISFKVMMSAGRTYTLKTTGALGKDVTEWTKGSFSIADPSAALQTSLTTGSAITDQGYRIIFVKKEGTSRFYQLNVE